MAIKINGEKKNILALRLRQGGRFCKGWGGGGLRPAGSLVPRRPSGANPEGLSGRGPSLRRTKKLISGHLKKEKKKKQKRNVNQTVTGGRR